MANDDTNVLHRQTSSPSHHGSAVSSSQFSITKFAKCLQPTTTIFPSFDHKIPAPKSSEAFSKAVASFITVIEIPTKEPTSSLDSPSEQQQSLTPHRRDRASRQPQPIPTRSTSLRQRPKVGRIPLSMSMRGRSHRRFDSIDSMLALTTNPASPSGINSSPMQTKGPSVSPSRRLSAESTRSTPATEYLTRQSLSEQGLLGEKQRLPRHNTVISWTSDASRAAEYEKIDRAHTGLRGLCRQLIPRCWRKDGRRDFFDGECDGDSVRRYRLSIPKKLGRVVVKSAALSCF